MARGEGRVGGERRRNAVVGALLVVALAVLVATRFVGEEQPQAGPARPGADRATGATGVVRPVAGEPVRVPDQELAGLRFVDVTRQVGLDPRRTGPEAGPTDMDAGAAVADLDDDGDLDLLLTSAGPASGLHRNDDGSFTDITRRSGITGLAGATVPRFADVDGDDDLDLFLGGPDHSFGRLLVNDGSGRFVDRTAARGVAGRPDDEAKRRSVRGADFGDVDGDGDLDLVVTDWNSSVIVAASSAGAGPGAFAGQCEFADHMRRVFDRGEVPPTGDTRLLLNDGTGHFTDGTAQWGLQGLAGTLPFTPQLHDLDGDGWLDLLVAGDVCTSRVFRNVDGRRFLDHTTTSGAGRTENGMGSLVHDLDGDGRPDWMVTSIGYPTGDGSCPQVSLFAGCSGNRVFLNRGDMEFTDATDELGLRNSWWGWGVAAADFTNQGEVQVAVTNGRVPATAEPDPDDQEDVYYEAFRDDPTQLWLRRTSGTFVDVAGQVGLDHDGVGHALVPFDHDRDGRVDLLVTNAGAAPVLYRNVTTPRRHWVGLRLHDPGSPGSSAGLGARVEVTGSTGAPTTRWVHTSGSYQAHLPAELHVGLGDAAGPARVRVWWPGEDTPQVVADVPVDRVVTITRRR